MKRKNKYTDKKKVGDFPIGCGQCGMPCWFSTSTVLDKNTGKGGLRVCPVCVDAVDYGLIPYKVRSESSIPDSSNYQTDVTDGSTIPDLSTFDPLSGNLPE